MLVSTLLLSACAVHHHPAPVAAAAPPATSEAPPVAAVAPPVAAVAPPVAATPPATAVDAAPPAVAPSPAAPVRSFVEVGHYATFPITAAERDAASAELARRFTVAKQFLLANKSTYAFNTAYLGRVGRPDELAPIVEVAGGGYVLGLHRNVAGSRQHPEVVRLDARGAVLWTLELPRSRVFNTYEVTGVLFAPDGALVAITTPYMRSDPRPAMLAKVTLDGRLVWSMQLRQDPALDGPFPQDLRIAPDGTIALTGFATYLRERVPGSSDNLRTWTGSVSRDGRELASLVGALYKPSASEDGPYRRIFLFWHDLYRPYGGL